MNFACQFRLRPHGSPRPFETRAGFGDRGFLEAGNGAEGLEQAKEHAHALVLRDRTTPAMSGVDFLRALRASGNTTTFGLVTSEATQEE